MADKPNEQDLFPLLRKVGLVDDEPYIAIEAIKDMASSNIIVRFESKLDTIGARMDSLDARMEARMASLEVRMDARMDAQLSTLTSLINATNSKLKFLMWIVSIGIAVIGLGPILLKIFGIPA